MKKILYILTLVLSGHMMYAASMPSFSVGSQKIWGMPQGTVSYGPLKYNINARRLAYFLLVDIPICSLLNAYEDDNAEQFEKKTVPKSKTSQEKDQFIHTAKIKEAAATIAADVIYDSIDPYIGQDTTWTQTAAKWILHSAIYNVTRNAANGFKQPKLYVPIIEIILKP